MSAIKPSATLAWTDRVPAAREIPDAVVRRLPGYLHALSGLAERGARTVSSIQLAELSGVSPATLRKDLANLGSFGTRGVGYRVDPLIVTIRASLGLQQPRRVIIIGAGHLGRALAAYPGFSERGFTPMALLDNDPAVLGESVGDLRIRALDDLPGLIEPEAPAMVVLAVPAQAAQSVAEAVVAAGVTAILNFAPVVLHTPDEVEVRHVDLSTELQLLAFHAGLRGAVDDHEVAG